MNGMRNLKTSLLTLLSCCSPDPTTNSEIPNPEFSRISQSINQFLVKRIGENLDNICTFGIVSGSGEHQLELNVLALHDV